MEVITSATPFLMIAGVILLGYLLGSIPFGLVITKFAGLGDIRSIGSGNIGATNVLRTGRRDLALATLLLDAGKAGLAYWICVLGADWYADGNSLAVSPRALHSLGLVCRRRSLCRPLLSGVAEVQGRQGRRHFRRPAARVDVARRRRSSASSGCIAAFVFRMSSLAALVATLMTPVLAYWLNPGGDGWIVTGALAVLIYWRHRANSRASSPEPNRGSARSRKKLRVSPANRQWPCA